MAPEATSAYPAKMTYDEEALSGMNYIRQDNRSLSENWSGIGLDHEGQEDEVAFSDFDNHNTFSSSNKLNDVANKHRWLS
ncbi:hypothetical protein OsI_29814 [Oryza sativa Indica Group]|uniref:Uncharacterized protein n=1 Tax=Oryza sativa subsp. indica TaxID=39946 RepID=B8BCA5_ORYSI|nr:hypothetical protein OsI_29814 [Oryza sativa Indica Group]